MALTTNGSGGSNCTPAAAPGLSPTGDDDRQPDPDAIKMFVGQVPRHMDEAQLKVMFEEYGPVHQINVLRDKVTGQSKGCCFVTFFTRRAALEAQNQLHNIRTLPGMHHPIQMKPADTENRNERKLFIGMVSKKCDESEVRALFARFGTIEECTVLRDQNNHSRGCAFVTFASRQNAINAIKAMHQSQTMDGCSAPLVVKFADTQRDRDSRRLGGGGGGLLGSAAGGPGLWPNPAGLPAGPFTPQYLSLLHQLSSATAPGQLCYTAGDGQSRPVDTRSSCGSELCHSLLSLQNGGPPLNTSGSHQQLDQQSQQQQQQQPQQSQQQQQQQLVCQLGSLTAAALVQAHLTAAAHSPAGKRIEGPEGCNLFIYHLPQEFSDSDLAHTFLPFGNVISAKVFIDKQTNLSKCFGFVSYDRPASAQTAIQAMNGFQIGSKRLKVQLKRCKETSTSKPY